MPLTTIASFREAYAAHIARAKLEAEGIPAFVTDEHLVGVQPLYADALGGVKLRVPEEFADRALVVVFEDRSHDLRGVAERRPASRRGRRCPSCGSRAVRRRVLSREPRAARGAAQLWRLWVNQCRCEDCGARW